MTDLDSNVEVVALFVLCTSIVLGLFITATLWFCVRAITAVFAKKPLLDVNMVPVQPPVRR